MGRVRRRRGWRGGGEDEGMSIGGVEGAGILAIFELWSLLA